MSSSLKFTNSSKKSIKVIVEPWADEYIIKEGWTADIVSEDHFSDIVEFEFDGDDIIIYGWSGVITVLVDGVQLEPQFDE